MVVVDCNVLAQLLIDGVETPRARCWSRTRTGTATRSC